jgi:hypothetical protein
MCGGQRKTWLNDDIRKSSKYVQNAEKSTLTSRGAVITWRQHFRGQVKCGRAECGGTVLQHRCAEVRQHTAPPGLVGLLNHLLPRSLQSRLPKLLPRFYFHVTLALNLHYKFHILGKPRLARRPTQTRPSLCPTCHIPAAVNHDHAWSRWPRRLDYSLR